MTVKIGINGFGRIGRLAFRRIFELQARGGQAGDIEVAAINDLTTPSMLAYLLKYDSTHGTFRHDDGTPVEVTSTDDSIVVDGKEYKVYAEKDANNIPWVKNDGVEFVLECTGFYTSAEKSQAHINAGAKKVVISAPAGSDLPTIVYNVNHETLTAEDNIISAASCTTNCLAPMAKGLNDFAPIVSGIMTTIHAFTGDDLVIAAVVALRRIVLQQVSEHIGRGEVVDSNDLGALMTEHLTECQTTDATEAVDSNLYCHACLLSLGPAGSFACRSGPQTNHSLNIPFFNRGSSVIGEIPLFSLL